MDNSATSFVSDSVVEGNEHYSLFGATSSVSCEAPSSFNQECDESDDGSEQMDCPIDKFFRKQVSQSIGNDVRALGRELGLTEDEIDNIVLRVGILQPEDVAYKIIDTWEKREEEKATKKMLLGALKEVARMDIVDRTIMLSIKHGNQSSSSKSNPTDMMKDKHLLDLQTRLQEMYKRIKLKGLPWMDKVNITLSDYYVELLMLQQDENGVDQPHMPIELTKIFELSSLAGRRQHRILVEGGPGYGKTTLGYKLCYDFALKIDYVKNLDLALVLPLREFTGDLKELLIKVCGVCKRDAAGLLSVFYNKLVNMLLILDGFDELPAEHRPVIISLITGDIFPHATIVVTSRPGMFALGDEEIPETCLLSHDASIASDPFSRRIRITGIPVAKVEEFAEKHLTKFSLEKKELVLEQLKSFIARDVVSLTFLQCPLFLLMVILLLTNTKYTCWQKCNTKTELYKQVMNFVVTRYLTKTDKFAKSADLFLVNHTQSPFYVNLMIQFGQFSVQALKSNKVYFSQDEMSLYSNTDAVVQDLGLLTKSVMLDGFRKEVYYEPVHKSLMEFAAAYFLWKEFENGQSDQWKRNIYSLRPTVNTEFSLVFLFLVGLMKDAAPALFEVLQPYAAEYTADFRFLIYSLLDVQVTAPVLNSLLPLLPTEWYLPFYDGDVLFSFSCQHKEILAFGLEMGRIQIISWFANNAVSLPENTKVSKMVLIMAHNFIPLSESKYQKIECVDLYCWFDKFSPSSNVWENFLFLLSSICFQRISFIFEASSCAFFLPLLRSAMVYGPLRNISIYRLICKLKEERSLILEILVDLVQREKVVGLWIEIDPIANCPPSCSISSKQLREMQCEIDYLISFVSKSRLLLQFILNNSQRMKPIIDLTILFDAGQKSWEWIRLENVRVKYTTEIQDPNFEIEHLWLCENDNQHMDLNLLHSCQINAFSCNYAFLAQANKPYALPKHLTELRVVLDACIFDDQFPDSLKELTNLYVLGLGMSSFESCLSSLPVDTWLQECLKSAAELKGIELQSVEQNFCLAAVLVQAFINYLATSATLNQETIPKLNYLLVSCDMECSDTELSKRYFQFMTLVSCLKQPLRTKLFSRLDILSGGGNALILMPPVKQTDTTSLLNVFSTTEGFKVKHEFWGMREGDPVCSRQFCEFFPSSYHIFSISYIG